MTDIRCTCELGCNAPWQSPSECPMHSRHIGGASRCVWCHRLGHTAEAHPLPKDHPQYDAFYDASDEELAVMVSNAIAPGRARTAETEA